MVIGLVSANKSFLDEITFVAAPFQTDNSRVNAAIAVALAQLTTLVENAGCETGLFQLT